MSNLKQYLIKRRSKFYEGETLRQICDEFLAMVDTGCEVHEFPDAVIVLEPYGIEGNWRGWLLFDRFTKGTATAMKKVSDEFKGKSLYASTHDVRIRDLLMKFGYKQYAQDDHDYYLKRCNYGV